MTCFSDTNLSRNLAPVAGRIHHRRRVAHMPAVVALVLAALSLPAMSLSAQTPIPTFGNYVTDLVHLLSPEDAKALNHKLSDLEKKKGSQIFVLLVASTDDEPIEDFAQRVFEAWKPGRKGVNDGILFVVALEQHRMRIHTGYGLEGAVPDALGKRILDRIVAPAFREKRFAEGINAGVDALIAAIEGEPLPAPVASRWSGDVASSSWVWIALGIASFFCGILGVFQSRILGFLSLFLSAVSWGPVLFFLPEVVALGSLWLWLIKIGLGGVGIVNALALLYFIGSRVGDSSDSSGSYSSGSGWSSGSSGWSSSGSDSSWSSSSDSSSSDSSSGGGGGDSGGGGSSSDW